MVPHSEAVCHAQFKIWYAIKNNNKYATARHWYEIAAKCRGEVCNFYDISATKSVCLSGPAEP